MPSKFVYAIATTDTKGAELRYTAERRDEAGASAKMVDVGVRTSPTLSPDVPSEDVAACHAGAAAAVLNLDDRGQAFAATGVALREWTLREFAAGRVAGIIGLGGTGGTALITKAMRALPIGLPKVMVSTVAGGNVSADVGSGDIVMFPSVAARANRETSSPLVNSNEDSTLAGPAPPEREE